MENNLQQNNIVIESWIGLHTQFLTTWTSL